jgi:hypothetical protein
MTNQERRSDEAERGIPDRADDDALYEPPRLAVIGSLEELTQGTVGTGADFEVFAFS